MLYTELVDKGRCDNGFIWNPSIFKCGYDISCNIIYLDYHGIFGLIMEYLDYEYCNCRKKLIENWLKNVVKILREMKWFIMWLWMIMEKSCTLCIVLLIITFIIIIDISSTFFFFFLSA